jgi:hypothetical protein
MRRPPAKPALAPAHSAPPAISTTASVVVPSSSGAVMRARSPEGAMPRSARLASVVPARLLVCAWSAGCWWAR